MSTHVAPDEHTHSMGYISPALRSLAMPVAQIQILEGNPRKGHIEDIAKSLSAHGQQKPVVVYMFPGSENLYSVIAGNHTYQAAVSLGWEYIAATEFTGTPEEAWAYSMADNKTSDASRYDEALLAKTLDKLHTAGKLDKAGYDQDELAYLTSKAATLIESEKQKSDKAKAAQDAAQNAPDALGASMSENMSENIDAPENGPQDGVVAYTGYRAFPSSNRWGMPDMLDLWGDAPDKPLRTWPGSNYADLDWQNYWMLVWSWSIQNAPYSRSYLCFFTEDAAFEPLWATPERYIRNLVSAGMKAIVEPDFSMYADDPFPVRLFNLYRQRWLARYFQEAGLRVIPCVGAGPTDQWNDIMYSNLPKGLPCVAMQVQTGIKPTQAIKDYLEASIKNMLARLEPQAVILYGGVPGLKMAKPMFPETVRVIPLATVQDVRRRFYKQDKLTAP